MKNSLQLLLGINSIVALHLAVRMWLEGVDYRLSFLVPFTVSLACSYWLVIARASRKKILLIPIAVASTSTAAVVVERLLLGITIRSGTISTNDQIGVVVLSLFCGVAAGAVGLAIKAAIKYAFPPWPSARR